MNNHSKLLTEEENNNILNKIDTNFICYSMSVIELYESNSNQSWCKKYMGILCFVKNIKLLLFYFRLYSITGELLWEQELYKNFRIKCSRPYFLSFETDTNLVGLNFADVIETNYLINTLRITSKAYRLEREKLKSSKKDKKINKRNFKKQIGQPQEFRHLEHVGFTEEGFDITMASSQWKKLIEALQLPNKEKILANEKSHKIIQDYVEEHGGIEAVVNTMNEYEHQKQKKESAANKNISSDIHIEKSIKPEMNKISTKKPIPPPKPKLRPNASLGVPQNQEHPPPLPPRSIKTENNSQKSPPTNIEKPKQPKIPTNKINSLRNTSLYNASSDPEINISTQSNDTNQLDFLTQIKNFSSKSLHRNDPKPSESTTYEKRPHDIAKILSARLTQMRLDIDVSSEEEDDSWF